VTKDNVIFFKKWFSNYCKSFYSPNSEDQKNIHLKEEHTFHVCKNILEIAKELSLSESEMMLAETVALFHDIGRFPQYAKFKTFRDSISVNHGFLGARTLLEEKQLQILPDKEQELIIQAVRFHNAFSISKGVGEDIGFFIKLIRDADKLDIWRVFLEFYEGPEEERASAVSLGLPDTPGYSEEVLSHIHGGQMAPLSKAKTLNDFKLVQLSWIYNLNFSPSFKMLLERNYIDRIVSKLPQRSEIEMAALALKEFVHKGLT